jgi:hypothetical protein
VEPGTSARLMLAALCAVEQGTLKTSAPENASVHVRPFFHAYLLPVPTVAIEMLVHPVAHVARSIRKSCDNAAALTKAITKDLQSHDERLGRPTDRR